MATLLRAGAPTRPPQLASSTWAYFARFARHPRRTWTRLLADPARLRYGFAAVLLVGLGYAGTVGAIALSNGRPSMPWLAIPEADYFTWEAIFIAPVTVLCWILTAGVMHLLSRVFHGNGSFEDTLALLGFAIALPTLLALIPDAARAALTTVGAVSRTAWEHAVSQPGTLDWLFLWSYMLAYAVALLYLFTVSVATAQRLQRWPAVAVGVAGAVVYQAVYLIFIR